MATGGDLDLMSATFDDLCSLPGVGPALARRILSFRQSGGSLSKVDDLGQIEGVTPALLERLRPHVKVSAPRAAVASSAFGPNGDEPQPEPAPPAVTEPDAEAPAAPTSVGEPAGDTTTTETTPVEPPPGPARPVFSQEENWPRGYGGVNPAVLFGEADHPTKADAPAAAPPGRLTPMLAVLLVLAGSLLGAAITLGALYAFNGTVYFVARGQWDRDVTERLAVLEEQDTARASQVQAQAASLEALQAQVTGAEEGLAALQTSVAALSGRVDDLETAQAEVEALSDQVATLQSSVDEMSGRVDRFGTFLESLSAALQDAMP